MNNYLRRQNNVIKTFFDELCKNYNLKLNFTDKYIKCNVSTKLIEVNIDLKRLEAKNYKNNRSDIIIVLNKRKCIL